MRLDTIFSMIHDSVTTDWVSMENVGQLQYFDAEGAEFAGEANCNKEIYWPAHKFLHVHSSDVNLSIATGMKDGDFDEPWAPESWGKTAITTWVDVLWAGRPVSRFLRIVIPRRSTTVPYPDNERMVHHRALSVIRKVNDLESWFSLDEVLAEAGLTTRIG